MDLLSRNPRQNGKEKMPCVDYDDKKNELKPNHEIN